MRSTILMSPGNSQHIKALSHMATTQNGTQQQLTFYEDLYLKPYGKSASLYNRRSHRNSAVKLRNSRRQSSLPADCYRTSSESPVNNPLLDSPPSSRPLTLHHRDGKHQQTGERDPDSDSNNNDYNDYLRLSETAQLPTSKCTSPITPIKHHKHTIYENHPFFSSSKTNTTYNQNNDHFYEVIPAQELESPITKHRKGKYLTDESNYLLSSVTAKHDRHTSFATDKNLNEGTNLRTMRKMGRSADSIRNMQGSKLREQSTMPTSQARAKKINVSGIGNSASWDNITANEYELSRLSSGLVSLDKEDTTPYRYSSKQSKSRHGVSQRPASTSGVSPKCNRYEESTSLKSNSSNSLVHSLGPSCRSKSSSSMHSSMSRSSTSVHNQNMSTHSLNSHLRSTPSTLNKHLIQPDHRHSSSFAGTTSAYENVAEIQNRSPQNINTIPKRNTNSNYVNIQEYIKPDTDLNYADLDFTLPTPSKSKRTSSHSVDFTRCVTPTKPAARSEEADDDKVEYTLINIAATQAARLACAEHQQYRQRHDHTNGTNK